MPKYDFEVHVGFTKGSYEVRDLLEFFPGSDWDIRDVHEIDHTVGETRMFKNHGVDGDLGWLVSRHVSSIEEVLSLANKAGEQFKGQGSVSVEVEQVLSVSSQGEKLKKFNLFNYEPSAGDFHTLFLESDPPLFEVHHIFSPKNFGGKHISVNRVIDWSKKADLDIHEVVLFGGAGKITTTQFFDTARQMETALPILNKKIEDKLVSTGIITGYKTVAERIITVGDPIH